MISMGLSAADLQQFYFLVAAGMFLLGLIFGSFLNVCIYRMPQGLSVVAPGSACPACHAAIRARDNIPILSWIILRGRCRDCKARISPRYTIIELLTGILFSACFWRFGFELETVKACAFSFLLTGLIFTDADCKLLPDGLTLSGLALGLGFSLIVPVDSFASSLLPSTMWGQLPLLSSWRIHSLLDSAIGAAVGASFIYGVAFLYLQWKGIEGMGFGDVKLMAMIGAFLGVRMTIFVIFGGALTGSIAGLITILIVWRKRAHRRQRQRQRRKPSAVAPRRAWQSAALMYRRYEMPFGVFLGSVAMVALFFGNYIVSWYLQLYGVRFS